MKNILVVSDNYELLSFFQKELCKQSLDLVAHFSYACTVLNKYPHDLISIGAVVTDMKDQKTINKITENFDLVISLHCKQIFPESLVCNVICVNFHPGFNPYNRGWYPQVFSILKGEPIGATLHLIDANIDHGAIILQKEVDVSSSDTSFDVYRKVICIEKELIEEGISLLVSGQYKITPPSGEGEYNSLFDFKELCHLDLNRVGTLGSHINLLRALTHDNLRNAYFFDMNNRKVFVKINLESDE